MKGEKKKNKARLRHPLKGKYPHPSEPLVFPWVRHVPSVFDVPCPTQTVVPVLPPPRPSVPVLGPQQSVTSVETRREWRPGARCGLEWVPWRDRRRRRLKVSPPSDRSSSRPGTCKVPCEKILARRVLRMGKGETEKLQTITHTSGFMKPDLVVPTL